MGYDTLVDDVRSLPVEAQREVADFIAFLKQQYRCRGPRRESARKPLGSEPFVGMWRDREDMTDSTAWVREVRRREWTESDG
jgi:hypothetical protein